MASSGDGDWIMPEGFHSPPLETEQLEQEKATSKTLSESEDDSDGVDENFPDEDDVVAHLDALWIRHLRKQRQLLYPDNRLSLKSSVMEIFEPSRNELDAILAGEGESDEGFVDAMQTVETKVWEPAWKAAESGGSDSGSTECGSSFETVYEEYVASEHEGLQTYSRLRPDTERWEELH